MIILDKAIDTIAVHAMGGLLTYLRIAETRENPQIPTACLEEQNGRFIIHLNPDFVQTHADTPVKLGGLLLHELMHKAIGFDRYPHDELYNVAIDAYINAVIYKLAPELTELMESYYPKDGVLSILRPGAKIADPELRVLYKRLYDNLGATIPEIAEALKKFGCKSMQTKLLGNHNKIQVGKEIRSVITQAIYAAGKQAGIGKAASFLEIVVEPIKSDNMLYVMSRAAVSFLTGRITSQVLGLDHPTRSVLAGFYSGRTESVYLAMGLYPLLHTIPQPERHQAVRVYVDVSNSMRKYYEFIYGVLTKLEDWLMPECYMFSTMVMPATKENFKKGHIKTTYGTDYNCVADHLIKHPIERALIFSDGYATITNKNLSALKKSGTYLVGAIVEKRNWSSDLYKMCGEVIYVPPTVTV